MNHSHNVNLQMMARQIKDYYELIHNQLKNLENLHKQNLSIEEYAKALLISGLEDIKQAHAHTTEIIQKIVEQDQNIIVN